MGPNGTDMVGRIQSISAAGEIALQAGGELSDKPAVGSIVAVGGTAGSIARLNHGFNSAPAGNDIFASFGNWSQVPIVGNFGPPVAGGGGGGAGVASELDAASALGSMNETPPPGRGVLIETAVADAVLADLRLLLLNRSATSKDPCPTWPFANNTDVGMPTQVAELDQALEVVWDELG
jgi:hypothetical protein